jgi:hypothetical protein
MSQITFCCNPLEPVAVKAHKTSWVVGLLGIGILLVAVIYALDKSSSVDETTSIPSPSDSDDLGVHEQE